MYLNVATDDLYQKLHEDGKQDFSTYLDVYPCSQESPLSLLCTWTLKCANNGLY